MAWILMALAFALSGLGAFPASARSVDGVAAVVDGHVITRSEVEELVETRRLLGGDPAKNTEIKKEALEDLIEQSLVQEEGDRLGIRVTDDDVATAVSEIRQRNGMDEETFRKALAAQGLDYPQYEREIRTQIRRVKVAGQVLRSRLSVSDEALREYYLRHVADFSEPDQVRLTHVELSRDRSAAEALREKIAAGEEMEMRRKGSDMGFLSLESLSDEVRRAVRGLSPGGVSPVVEIGDTCHLFIVEEEKGGRIPAYEQVADEVRDRYFRDREDELYRTWIESLKEKARIERKL
jgi:parvulin-like peptidyl-prolyl isomerase